MSLCVRIRKRLAGAFSLNVTMSGAGALGILGASGCGKSMTLKCIAGIETPDDGRIELNGRVLFDAERGINLRAQERRVGYLFQNYALFPRMTALENVLCGAYALAGKNEKLRRAREYLRRLGLSGCEGQRPAALSGGQQQRVALARMLIAEPELILLDEPFSALDSSLRERMQIEFARTLAGRQLVLVTHSRGEAYRLCEEIVVMDAGATLIQAEGAALFADPQTVAAARITGCKNISRIRQTGEHTALALDWGLALRFAASLRPGTTHAGIRARDIAAVSSANAVRPAWTRTIHAPFEDTHLFTNADSDAPGEIWWKTPRPAAPGLPERLFLPPQRLLQLV